MQITVWQVIEVPVAGVHKLDPVEKPEGLIIGLILTVDIIGYLYFHGNSGCQGGHFLEELM